MPAADLTTAEATDIGKMCRDYGNPMIGAFAAEMAGESYPFNAPMVEIMLKDFTDEQVGRKFAAWCDKADAD